MYPLDATEVDANHAIVCVADKPALKRLVGMTHGSLVNAGGRLYTYRDDVGEQDLYENNMASLGDFTQVGSGSWAVVSGRAEPTVIFGATDGWWGPGLLRDIGKEVTDSTFVVVFNFQTSAANQQGRIILELLDSSMAVVYSQEVSDSSSAYSLNAVSRDSTGALAPVVSGDVGANTQALATGAVTLFQVIRMARKGRQLSFLTYVENLVKNNVSMRPFRYIRVSAQGLRSGGVNQALPVAMQVVSISIQSSRVNRCRKEKIFSNNRDRFFYLDEEAGHADTAGWRFWQSNTAGSGNDLTTAPGIELEYQAKPFLLEYQNSPGATTNHASAWRLQAADAITTTGFVDVGPDFIASANVSSRQALVVTPGSATKYKCLRALVVTSRSGRPSAGGFWYQTATPYVMPYDDELLIKPNLMSGAWVPASVTLDDLISAQEDADFARVKRLEVALGAEALPMAFPSSLSPGFGLRGHRGALPWASIGAGAEGSVSVALPDARPGDLVNVIAPIGFLSVAGLRVSRALVTAPGVVTIYVLNHTGGGLTPNAGSAQDPWGVTVSRPTR